MPLPIEFPQPPKRPPSSEPMGSQAWLTYFDRLDRFMAAVRDYLNNLP